MITTREAAAIIGCSIRHVNTLIGLGVVRARKDKHLCNKSGPRWLVYESSARAYAATPQSGGFPRGQSRT